MIKVKVGDSVRRTEKVVDKNTTLVAVLEDAGVNYTDYIINLNGDPLTVEELQKTFADFNVGAECSLIGAVKSDNSR